MQWRSSPRLRAGVRAARADIQSALWEAALTPLAFRTLRQSSFESVATSVWQVVAPTKNASNAIKEWQPVLATAPS